MVMNLNNQLFTSCHVASLKVLALSLPFSVPPFLFTLLLAKKEQ